VESSRTTIKNKSRSLRIAKTVTKNLPPPAFVGDELVYRIVAASLDDRCRSSPMGCWPHRLP
jgi:hypothetical protein